MRYIKVVAIVVGIILVAASVTSLVRRVGDWFGGGISVTQQVTIDSLRHENQSLTQEAAAIAAALSTTQAHADSLRRALQAQAKAAAAQRTRGDSLEALIPDTMTMVPIALHEAIVAQKDSAIQAFADLYAKAEAARAEAQDSLEARTRLLGRFQAQNTALLAQMNDLARKANPNILRRAGYALPFLASLYGGCKLHLVDCT